MNKRIKVKKPSLVAKYTALAIEKISEMGAGYGVYAYRGQANEDWDVVSAAYRRLEKFSGEPPRMEEFINYHEQELINPARMGGYDLKDGRRVSDLELLAELQHFGAATCLVDFTRNFQTALWFACQPGFIKSNANQATFNADEKISANGKIVIMNINDIRIFSILNESDLKQDIEPVLEFKTRLNEKDVSNNQNFSNNPSYWHWAPHGMNQRILKQDSLFVFGPMKIDGRHVESIIVKGEDKARVLIELENIGISKDSLFQDFHGFASMQGHMEAISMKNQSADALFRAGNVAYQRKELDSALQFHNVAISKDPYNSIFYVNRAATKFAMNQFEESISDLNEAIKLDASDPEAYFGRGITHWRMENYSSAIEDFTKSRNLDDSNFHAYTSLGDVYMEIDNIDEAIKNFTEAIKLNDSNFHAYLGRGTAYSNSGDYDDAIKDLTKSINLGDTNSTAYIARGCVYLEMKRYREAMEDFNKSINIDPEQAHSYYFRSLVHIALGDKREALTDLERALELSVIQGIDELTQKIREALKKINDKE